MNGSNRIRLLRARSKDETVQAEALATKAVGYIRVSTEEQATHGHGLEVQRRAILSFAESQGYTLVDIVSIFTEMVLPPLVPNGRALPH